MYLWLWLETLQSRAFVLPLVLSVLLLPRPSTSRGGMLATISVVIGPVGGLLEPLNKYIKCY